MVDSAENYHLSHLFSNALIEEQELTSTPEFAVMSQ